jgi:hypothetical protein
MPKRSTSKAVSYQMPDALSLFRKLFMLVMPDAKTFNFESCFLSDAGCVIVISKAVHASDAGCRIFS